MSFTGIALIIIGIAFSILALTLIPAFQAVKVTAISLGLLSELIQHEQKHTLQELSAEWTEIKTIVRAVFKHTGGVTRLMIALVEAGNNLHTINHAIGAVTGIRNTSLLCASGIKVAGKYVLERRQKNTRWNLIMSEKKEISTGTVLVSFAAGAAIGAGLALLYAPKSGNEMRRNIADITEDSKKKIKEYTKKPQDKIKTAIEDSYETLIEKKSILASAIESGRKTQQEVKERDTTL